MLIHEEFQELCARAAIGRLNVEELTRLESHLSGCSSCRVLRHDYAALLALLPCPDGSLSNEALSVLRDASYRERFLATALAEGIDFSTEARKPGSVRRWRQVQLPKAQWLYAAAALVVLAVATAAISGLRSSTVISRPAAVISSSQVTNSVGISASAPAPLQPPSYDSQSNAADLRQLRAELATVTRRANELQRELSTQTNKNMQLSDENLQLTDETRGVTARLSELQQQIATLTARKQELETALATSQADLAEIATKLHETTVAHDRERELTAAARDVTTLMGARNLHITDVFDVDPSGTLRRSFGRVFYAEGQSLIFYAFDLPDGRGGRKVSFQAWGQKEGKRAAVARNLGIFVIDEREQHRWVLRVDDPQLVSGIDSVFVTVEPLGGANKPTGRKLMYAFLGGQANHP